MAKNFTKFQTKYGPWALVTGASAGLGAVFAHQLAERGLNVVLVARRKEKLDSLATELQQKYKIETLTISADLSKTDFLNKVTKQTNKLEIGLLINNAGFGISGRFLENSIDQELAMLRVNCEAPLLLTHHYGNEMKKRKKGGIIFLGSLLGYNGVPFMSHYAATKGFNVMLGEALWRESRRDGIDVLSLSPGATISEFADTAGMNTALAMRPEPVVRAGLNTLGKRPTIIAGLRNKFMYYSMLPLTRRIKAFILGSVMSSYIK